jgi:hypothetical protein
MRLRDKLAVAYSAMFFVIALMGCLMLAFAK